MKKKRVLLLASAVCIGTLIARMGSEDKAQLPGHPRDYAEIAASDTLRVCTEYNSIGFFVGTDTVPEGFHYELAKAFAQAHGLQVTFKPEMDFGRRLEYLANGECDLMACNTLVSNRLKDSLLLSEPLLLSKQVLVQRRDSAANDSTLIKNQLQLAGKTLHIAAGAPVIQRIAHLSNEIGDTIYVKEVERYGAEQLIAMVAHGDIDLAVTDEHVARAAADSLPGIDISTYISFTQFYSWATSKKSHALMDSINTWLRDFIKSKEYRKIYQKYYD